MSGNKPSPWFKILALFTALGLGGAYVWRQQQTAAPPSGKSVKRTIPPSSKGRVIVTEVLPVDEEKTKLPALQQEPEEEERVLMPSSKSGVFRPEQDFPKQRTLLPSSKSPGSILDRPGIKEP